MNTGRILLTTENLVQKNGKRLLVQMIEEPLIFEKDGFPIIRVHEDYFEVKAIDFWNYRTFKYSEIKEFEYYNPNDKWWNILFFWGSWEAAFFADLEPSIFKVTKTNGGTYKYKCPYKVDKDLRKLIDLLEVKIRAELKRNN